MQKAFRRYPIELAACTDLYDREKERRFFDDCKMHFEHIRDTVCHTFHAPGYELDKKDAVLEPSYICEPLGLQRSEEHTSELQSRQYLVCRLLLEKKTRHDRSA